MDQLLEVKIPNSLKGWIAYSPTLIVSPKHTKKIQLSACFLNPNVSQDFWFTTRVKSILSYYHKTSITSFNVPKATSISHTQKMKNQASLGFYALGSPSNTVSTPCTFEALTCVLLYAMLQFFSHKEGNL